MQGENVVLPVCKIKNQNKRKLPAMNYCLWLCYLFSLFDLWMSLHFNLWREKCDRQSAHTANPSLRVGAVGRLRDALAGPSLSIGCSLTVPFLWCRWKTTGPCQTSLEIRVSRHVATWGWFSFNVTISSMLLAVGTTFLLYSLCLSTISFCSAVRVWTAPPAAVHHTMDKNSVLPSAKSIINANCTNYYRAGCCCCWCSLKAPS